VVLVVSYQDVAAAEYTSSLDYLFLYPVVDEEVHLEGFPFLEYWESNPDSAFDMDTEVEIAVDHP